MDSKNYRRRITDLDAIAAALHDQGWIVDRLNKTNLIALTVDRAMSVVVEGRCEGSCEGSCWEITMRGEFGRARHEESCVLRVMRVVVASCIEMMRDQTRKQHSKVASHLRMMERLQDLL